MPTAGNVGVTEELDPTTLSQLQGMSSDDQMAALKKASQGLDQGVVTQPGLAPGTIGVTTPETQLDRMTGTTVGGTPTPGSTPAAAPGAGPYDWTGLANYLKTSRNSDIMDGLSFGSNFFGQGNPEMAAILDERKKRAMGLNGDEIQAMRETGGAGINQQMATGLRALHGAQATSGVRGGAAAAQTMPIIQNANAQRGQMEQGIALADMQRRGTELNGYEQSLTGERAGLLGTGLGFASMGSADRSGAMQYGLGQDFINQYQGPAGAAPNMDDGSWNAKSALDKWKNSGYSPDDTPWSDWLHQNVFDKKSIGINTQQFEPNQYIHNVW